MVALWNSAHHYIFALWFLLFLSSPNLSRCRLDVCHTAHTWCGLSANFRCRSETCCTRLPGNAGRKSPKIAIWAPSHIFVGLYLRNPGTYRQPEKSLLRSNMSSGSPHNMMNFCPLAAEIGPVVWGTPANFNGFRVLAALLHGTLVVGVGETAALNRGRHLF